MSLIYSIFASIEISIDFIIMRRQIQITQELYEALSKLKKGQSFDAYLKGVVQILERDGTSVKDYEDPIDKLVKQQANRIIEVLRGVEKKQEKHLLTIISKMEFPSVPTVQNVGLSIEDQANIEALVKINQEQTELINNLKSENKRLKTDIELCRKTEERTDGKLSEEGTQELLELMYILRGKMVSDNFEESKLTILKGEFRIVADKIENTIKKYGSNCP